MGDKPQTFYLQCKQDDVRSVLKGITLRMTINDYKKEVKDFYEALIEKGYGSANLKRKGDCDPKFFISFRSKHEVAMFILEYM